MIVVTRAVPGDLDAAADVLAEAFLDDPVTSAIVGGADHDRLARMRHLFVAFLRLAIADGTVDVARRAGDPQVLGAAIWEAPDASGGLLRLARQLPSFWRAFGLGGLRRGVGAKAAIDRYRPRRPHWYLQEIGVAAAARGQGVGGLLLAARLADVDAADAPAYLESSTARNRRLYLRHGFAETMLLTGVAGEPMAMWRAPRSEREAAARDGETTTPPGEAGAGRRPSARRV
ncbi:putative acetyltransferase [Cellulomonas flavigena DSM 20109]|uniref:Putative acetyltransferase n=1 Tax=Cellulomonas flavigena (strain ATCC 482 / DSM 20109 / BCRC 11376 / JCM 18109 / NBRC 3775 / NCIMB 8073 / NRS 134) TaxID=446466 RepID=D5UFN2_CELFN|nr:putative acetyltransferase [Cellulomonas flavigena DSM 20109]